MASCKSKCGCKAQIRCAESEAASCEWFQAIVSGVITSLSTAKPLLPEIEIVILKPRADSEPFQTASFPLPKRNYLKNVQSPGNGATVKTARSRTRVGVSWVGGVDGTCLYCRHGLENLCDSPVFTGYDKHRMVSASTTTP